ncbi:hypothetical protein [Vibrio diabolicus]|uniref:hypothetical protein n=1 Tax=Vibrio diabolicus TaxID=50719 RepID=UPI0021603616|nr:hypothetical protein [Vibrio diabolicus]MCS0317837.1 hypothetical protein [Vibrio diabolicus]
MSASFPDLLISFEEAVEALKVKLSQDASSTITYNGEQIQSIAKDVEKVWAPIQAMVQGRLAYETKAGMDAAGAPPAGTVLAEVWNDSTTVNGLYGWNGTAWIKSPYDYLLNAIRGRQSVVGGWTKCETTDGDEFTLSNNRMYLLDRDLTVNISVQTDVVVPRNYVMYIDLDGPENPDEPGTFLPIVASVSAVDLTSGSNVPLWYNKNGVLFSAAPYIGSYRSWAQVSKKGADGYENSLRSRRVIAGRWTKFDVNTTDKTVTVSHSRMYLSSGKGSVIRIAIQTDIVIPDGYGMYVDPINGDLDGSDAVIPTVAPISSVDEREDDMFLMVWNVAAIVACGHGLMPFSEEKISSDIALLQSDVAEAQSGISAAQLNSEFGRYYVTGIVNIGSAVDDLSTFILNAEKVSVYLGGGSSMVRVKPLVNFSIPNSYGVFIDLNESLDETGLYTPTLSPNALVSSQNGLGAYVRDSKVLLVGTENSTAFGPLLDNRPDYGRFFGFGWVPESGADVSWDATTRTLSWSQNIYLVYSRGRRIRILPGSVTFPEGSLYQAYLSLKHLEDAGGYDGVDPAMCIFAARWYAGENRFYANDDQVPIFFYSSGQYGSLSGFPTPKLIGGIDTGALPDVVVNVAAPVGNLQSLAINLRDPGNPNGNYIQWTFRRDVDLSPELNQDVWHLQGAYVVEPDLITTVKQIIAGGENETAIKESGKADFCGGGHGDEITQWINMQLDGNPIDPTVQGQHVGKVLYIQQHSQLYEEGTQALVEWFKAWKTWEFRAGGEVEITQHLEFQRDAIVSDFYNCFLCIARNQDVNGNATTFAYGSQFPKHELNDLVAETHDRFELNDVTTAYAWGGGVHAKVEFLEGYGPQDATNITYDPNENFMFYQNGPIYNKMYFKQGFTDIKAGASTFTRYRYTLTSDL